MTTNADFSNSSTTAPASVLRAPRRRRGARGFSLIETMVSGSILLIGLAAVLNSIGFYQSQVANQSHMTQGIHIAEGVMEEILLAYPSDVSLAAGAHGPIEYDAVGHEVAAGGKYRAFWDVNPGDPIVGIRKLTVRVEWLEKNTPKNISFFTFRR